MEAELRRRVYPAGAMGSRWDCQLKEDLARAETIVYKMELRKLRLTVTLMDALGARVRIYCFPPVTSEHWGHPRRSCELPYLARHRLFEVKTPGFGALVLSDGPRRVWIAQVQFVSRLTGIVRSSDLDTKLWNIMKFGPYLDAVEGKPPYKGTRYLLGHVQACLGQIMSEARESPLGYTTMVRRLVTEEEVEPDKDYEVDFIDDQVRIQERSYSPPSLRRLAERIVILWERYLK